MSTKRRQGTGPPQTLLHFGVTKRSRNKSNGNEGHTVSAELPVSKETPLQTLTDTPQPVADSVGKESSVQTTTEISQLVTDPESIEFPDSAPVTVPDPEQVNTSKVPVTHYDVGDIVQGSVAHKHMSDNKKINYLVNHFTPPENFQSFISQTIVRGQTKQTKVLVFQHSWLQRYRWLVYSPVAGGGLCKYCVLFASGNDKRKYTGVLTSRPFTNLVKATGKDGVLEKHQTLQYHRDSVQLGMLLLQQQKNPKSSIPYVISEANQKMYQKNIHILKSIAEAVILCGKQNLPLRGHRDDGSSTSSNKGNFLALLEMMAKRDDILREHLDTGKQNAQYTSKTIQNEVIDVVASYIRKENTRVLDDENAFFSLMADEVTDPHANQEILSVCLRVLNGYKVNEFFFDFVYLERATGKAIAEAIIESLQNHNIDINKTRGQSYDGASCMSSEKVGVQAFIKKLAPRALYVHCNSHVLNLSIASACKLPTIRNMIDTLNAVFLFFNLSPKRQRFLERILSQLAPEMQKKKLIGMCKTRWVERHNCYDIFYEMYEFLCECLRAILDPPAYPEIYGETWNANGDQESRIKAQGLLSSLSSFQTIISFIVAKNALENVRPIASKLQKRDLDIYQAYGIIDQTSERIAVMRHDVEEEFSIWFKDATRLATLLGTPISNPRAPRSARQMHRANAPSTSPSEYYLRNLAIPFCDHLSAEFQGRFNAESRKGVQILALLPGSITEIGDIQNVVNNLLFWEPDMPNVSSLRAEVKEWQRYWKSKDSKELSSSTNLMECLIHADEDVFPNIRTLLRIGCTLPVGSCEAERSFSCLRRIKTYLRNRMVSERLSGLALMNMNHDMEIDLERICQMFIDRNKRRMFSSCILYQ